MSHPVEVARQIHQFIEAHGPEDMPMVRDMIREAGIEPGVHVGDPPSSFTPDKTAEWWLGQIAQIIDDQAWWAMNSCINSFETLVASS